MCIKSKCAKVARSAEKKNQNQKPKVLSVYEFKVQEQKKKTKFVYNFSLELPKAGPKASKIKDVNQARIVPQNKNVSCRNATKSQILATP